MQFAGGLRGSYNGTPERYARTLTDESGLYGQRFWYDALGRIVLSQNTKQFNGVPKRYSYSLYDGLGRVYEAGELDDDATGQADRFRHVPGMVVGGQFKPDVIDPAVLKAWVQGRTRWEVTRTWYDAPMPGLNVPGFGFSKFPSGDPLIACWGNPSKRPHLAAIVGAFHYM